MSEPSYRRNFAVLLGDAIAYGLAITFASSTTILPDFIRKLTDSLIVVGLFSTVTSGAWLLPQLIYARHLMSKRRKKPYLVLGTAIGRPFYLLYAVALGLGLRDPRLALVLLFAAQVMFMGTDSLASVAWFDIYAKAIPVNRRGRMIGMAQAIRGVLAFGVGVLLTFLLSDKGPPFPQNYAVIFAAAGLCLLVSFIFLNQVREPDEPVESEQQPWKDYLPSLLRTLREDHTFRRLVLVRLLAGVDSLALYFYITFARDVLRLAPETVGVYNTVQTVGGILASLVLGAISERWGSQRVIQVATALSVTAPALGLGLYLGGAAASPWVVVVYGWVFLVIGVTLSAAMLGWFNYALELAPSGRRPTYMGLFNTSAGILIVLPPLGGWLQVQTSYGVLFAVTAAVLVLAHALTWKLPARQAGEG
jgi:MFS family permease